MTRRIRGAAAAYRVPGVAKRGQLLFRTSSRLVFAGPAGNAGCHRKDGGNASFFRGQRRSGSKASLRRPQTLTIWKGSGTDERRTNQLARHWSGKLRRGNLLLRLLLSTQLLPARLLLSRRRQARCACKRKVLLNTMTDNATKTEALWHAFSDGLRAFLRLRVPSDSDADDLLQDVFVRVYENINSLRQAGRVESWVYQIARNAITDFYRRRRPRSADEVEQIADPQLDSDNHVNQNQAVGAWLSLTIDSLPPTLRDALRMYEVEGLPQAEIANRLGLSLPGAKARVQRGRRQLGELLRENCRLELDRRGNVIACKPTHTANCAQSECACDERGSEDIAT